LEKDVRMETPANINLPGFPVQKKVKLKELSKNIFSVIHLTSLELEKHELKSKNGCN
jgi:hypothetical protein